ncbi:MAG: hypothetical protein ACLFV0_02795, partial [Nitriliruptoraceae bacterium]
FSPNAVDDRESVIDICAGRGTKFWVDYELTGEDEAYNAVGDEHSTTFTLQKLVPVWSVSQDQTSEARSTPLSQRVPVGDASLDITLDGDGDFTGLGDGDQPECITNEAGQCTVTYVSQEPGTTTVTASYEGSDADGNTRTVQDQAIKYWTDLEIVKTADPSSVVFGVGDQVVTYSLAISNPSDVPVTLTTLTDVFDPDGSRESTVDLTDDLEAALPSLSLESGAEVVVTFDYTVTSADAAAGEIDNTATVEGEDEGGRDLRASDDATVTVTTPPPPPSPGEPGIGVTKTADPLLVELPAGEDATGVVTYTYTVVNTGEVTLNDVTLTDDVLGDLTDELREEIGGSSLAVDGTVTFTFDQTVGVDDIGTLTNVAEATGTGGGDTATATDDATVEIVQVAGEVLEPGIEVVKEALVPVDDDGLQTVTVEEDGTAEVRYRYTITNTGNTTLEDLTLVDDVIGDLSGELEGVSLEPDGSTEVEVDYTTTRAQLDEGSVTNIATVTGTSPEGATVDDDDEVTVDLVEVLDTSITSPQEDDDATMPDTGAATTLLAVLALAMAALGSLLLMAGRRRRTSME